MVLNPDTPKGGASGGSGGDGGCGGRGGQGGGFGGASIGLVSFSGDVSLDSTSIVTGNGGDGGAGGFAQLGSAPGIRGIGGSSVGGSHVGCVGGNGGSLTASPGGVSYIYSASGELATRTDALCTTMYTYDARGFARSVSRPAPAATIEYIVDGRNRRVGQKVGGTLQQVFLYDEADRIIAELDGAGAVV